MQTSTAVGFLGIASIVGLVSFAACGGSVTSTSGAGGASTSTTTSSSHAATGTGTSTSTTSTSVGTTATGVSASSSSGVMTSSATGPMMSCDAACMKLQACANVSCQAFNINCQNASMQTQCYTDCINNGDCNDLKKLTMGNFATPTGMCLQGCMNMGGDGGMSCQQCALGNCGQAIQPCALDQKTNCGAWAQCLQGCKDNTCATNCDMMYQQAAMLYKPVYQCFCNSCKTECNAIDPCNH